MTQSRLSHGLRDDPRFVELVNILKQSDPSEIYDAVDFMESDEPELSECKVIKLIDRSERSN
jgi:hypothetical protein